MTTRRPGSGQEDGFSIVETVVALAVMMIIVPTFFGVIFTEVTSARIQRESAVDNQVMLGIAEAVKADAFDATCPAGPGPLTYAATLPPGWTGTVRQSCQVVATQPVSSHSLQLVTITVFVGAGQTGTNTSVVVVKSNPA